MTTVELLPVELRKVPVALWNESRRWFEELLREFAVVATSSPETHVPRQLLDFVEDVRSRFSRFSESTNMTLEEAHADGRSHIDLSLRLPAEAGPIALELYEHVLRADEFCRAGQLLTIELSERVRVYVEWYLGEVASQLQGGEPVPWSGSEA
ncbi:MAG TPA: hypothetical protein VMS74_13790 [Acidimicrobiia bacterium]|nr:hypothetical protein [Acidimicrobiia bacterium]